MTSPYTDEELRAGYDVLDRFWAFVGYDLDDELVELLTNVAVAYYGSDRGAAGRIREHLGATTEDCRTMEVWPVIEVLDDLRLRCICISAATDPERTWYVWLRLDEGRWLAEPVTSVDSSPLAWFDALTGESGNGPRPESRS